MGRASRHKQQRGLCPICEKRPKGTTEDILPQWARERMKSLGTFPKDQAPSVITRLCAKCNGNLGHHYEDEAAPLIGPMIEGNNCLLNPTSQGIISRWINKTNLLFHFAKAKNPPVAQLILARDILRHLAVQKTDVDASFIRLGVLPLVDPPDAPNEALHRSGALPPMAFSGVLSLGYLVWEAVIGDGEHVRPFAEACANNDALVRVSPTQPIDLEWPPPRALSVDDIHNLRAAWTTTHRWPVPSGTALSTQGAAMSSGFYETVKPPPV